MFKCYVYILDFEYAGQVISITQTCNEYFLIVYRVKLQIQFLMLFRVGIWI